MIDFLFNGCISVATENKDTFIEDFTKFLESKKANFRGNIRMNEFDDVEIIDD